MYLIISSLQLQTPFSNFPIYKQITEDSLFAQTTGLLKKAILGQPFKYFIMEWQDIKAKYAQHLRIIS